MSTRRGSSHCRLRRSVADSPNGEHLVDLVRVMARLRAECDWKSMQTHRSLARYLLEETYETLEAIDTGDLAHLREELGDLLLQVYFHAEIAAQHGDFDIDDVAGDLIAKLVRRNPHVFGDARVSGAASVNELWESVKANEKARDSVLDGIPPTLPALLYADKVLDRLSRTNRQLWPREPAVVAPRAGTNGPDDLGGRLLALVAECRESGVDPEQALREAVRRIL
jgi:XTP/dITP diphosphohydrolase